MFEKEQDTFLNTCYCLVVSASIFPVGVLETLRHTTDAPRITAQDYFAMTSQKLPHSKSLMENKIFK